MDPGTASCVWWASDGDKTCAGIGDKCMSNTALSAGVAVGDEVCEVESVKAVAEVYSPLGGEVVEVNESLEEGAEQINDAPYEAWLFKLKMGDAGELDALMSADDYRAKISS